MRRAVVLLSAIAAASLLAACGSGDPGGPTGPTATTSAPPVSVTPSPTGPTAEPTGPTSTGPSEPETPPDLDVPSDAPTSVDDPQALAAIEAGDFEALAPPGSRIVATGVETAPFEAVSLIWERGKDPFQTERGYVLWRAAGDAGWRAVYAFTDERRSGVLGITQEGRDDLTGDGVDETLTLESTGGSGACGVWRVISPSDDTAGQIFTRSTCDADASLERGHLVIREAVFGPDDPHCCPSSFRTTTYDWNGKRLVPSKVEEEAT